MTDAIAFVRNRSEPVDPPPIFGAGALAWARTNLFSSVTSSLTTLAFIALALWVLPPLVRWATVDAVWSAPDGALCREHQDGACWAFIGVKLDYLRFGSYPIPQRWRADAVEALGAVLIAWLLGLPRRSGRWARFCSSSHIRSQPSSCYADRRRSVCRSSTRCSGAASLFLC